jgi:hypothetical protein
MNFPDIPHETFQIAHLAIGCLTAAATALLGLMFWNSSLTNRDQFTTLFLKLLSMCAVAKALEITSAMYRAARIPAVYVPTDAAISGLTGRTIELLAYCVMIWFLLRPETKRKLNGGGAYKEDLAK